MKAYKFLSILTLVGILSISCSNEETGNIEETKTISKFEDYFNFINKDTDGKVLIQSISTINSNGETYSLATSIKGDKKPLTLKIKDKTINFDNYSYSNTSNRSSASINEDLSGVFGNKFSINLSKDGVYARIDEPIGIDNEPVKEISEVYIPETIKASFNGLSIDNKVVAGTTISWNVDTLNENGVVVGLEYNPYAQTKEAIVLENPERLLTGVTVQDIGTYTITAEDLKNYPSDATMTLYVGRAGYNITTDSTTKTDYSLAGLTVMRTDMEIQK